MHQTPSGSVRVAVVFVHSEKQCCHLKRLTGAAHYRRRQGGVGRQGGICSEGSVGRQAGRVELVARVEFVARLGLVGRQDGVGWQGGVRGKGVVGRQAGRSCSAGWSWYRPQQNELSQSSCCDVCWVFHWALLGDQLAPRGAAMKTITEKACDSTAVADGRSHICTT